ncbi:Zn-dependent protease with chaperone function [Saccharomonospora marina XMU15]|uniref:Zn-dependent protease with chaperone function n=1 Tax=Saccharomonospora marina XMU15 TaxID=882083 RepID=H5X4L4_9PSEU|nr:M48 family metallopeptidase [Saccharomonospora marina]EHR51090.1 Zn-dependent protease with chaperone function [Saccharomonospora marina XMU15]
MNFFERQQSVRKVSVRLVWLFALAVVGIVAVVDLAAFLAFGLAEAPTDTVVTTLAVVSGVTAVLIGLTSWIRTMLLRNGGGARVARSLGGVAVPEDTTDPNLRRLRNVVEEIAIASGAPVPDLYVLPHEPGINAFAAGWSPANAAVAVTGGALERLNRAELQGVIAHEFSHVVNGDMRLNIRLMGVLAGIVGLAVVGRILLAGGGRGGGRRDSGAGALVIVALAALAAGYIGVVAGRLIKAAVSRQREYLADASAVQYTRQTEGLAGALKKIGGLPTGSQLRSSKTEDVSHMLFGEGRKFVSLFATHPPLVERIRVLDPTFDPTELRRLRDQWSAHPPSGLREDAALGLTPAATPPPPPPRQAATLPARPDQVAANVGNPAASSYPHAGQLLARIPEDLLDRAHRTDTVVPLSYGLLLSADEQVRYRQYQTLAARFGQPLAEAALREAGSLARLDPELRLPLTEVALPALRHRPAQDIETVLQGITALAAADGRNSLFEYSLSTLLHRELYEAAHRTPPWGRRHTTPRRAHGAIATLLSVLADVGNPEPDVAEAAFRAGLARMLPSTELPYRPPAEGHLALDAAWPALDGLPARAKERLVEAIVAVIGHDGTLTIEESELLRTVCAMLHCPLPPLAGALPADTRAE